MSTTTQATSKAEGERPVTVAEEPPEFGRYILTASPGVNALQAM